MTRPNIRRILRGTAFGAISLASVAIAGGGCLDRPVAPATPNVSARVVEQAQQNKVSKIDLLFMIDNSSSMADKQEILAAAVPDLVNRLVNPICVDSKNPTMEVKRDATGACPAGSERDFEPVQDIHIGIITSSLGGHGSSGTCDVNDTRKTTPHNDDHGHLITRGPMDQALTTLGSKPFLNWNPMGGYTDAAMASDVFKNMVIGTGQHGCGYEAQLEAPYRFLIDPDPYDTLTVDTSQAPWPGLAVLKGTDTTLLQQRKDFLRPDSLVAVILMTDENDCSIIDGGQGFYALIPPSGSPAKSVLTHGTSACLTNPNDPCCFSCLSLNAPAGCASPANDAECMKGNWLKTEDPENLRCFNQKKRYGMDFLYPVQRYVSGFTLTQIQDRNGNASYNPLFCANAPGTKFDPNVPCKTERDKANVFVAGIVGVPWQDIAIDPSDLTKGYKTAKQMGDENIWLKILGDPQPSGGKPPVPPTDVHMIESVEPRSGVPGPNSAPNADPINGHDWDTSKESPPNSDLQYACVFPLAQPKTCGDMDQDCDCTTATLAKKSPLCQTDQGFSNQQVRAKGYPGIRELQVLQGLGEQAIVASICPANVNDATSADYGYRPAIAALIDRLRNALRGRCLPRPLDPDPMTGEVQCVVVEAFNPAGGQGCSCDQLPGRTAASTDVATGSSLADQIKAAGSCLCELHQINISDGSSLRACQTQVNPPTDVTNGWCYVDPAQQGPDGCGLVKACDPTERRLVRFVNQASEPQPGARAFIICQEKAFSTSGGTIAKDPCAM